MKFARFTNVDGCAVYINPLLVTAVCRSTNELVTGVELCGEGLHWEVTQSAEEVVSALERASKQKGKT